MPKKKRSKSRPSQSRPSRRKTVALDRKGQQLHITPPIPTLKEAFYTAKRGLQRDAEGTCRLVSGRVPLIDEPYGKHDTPYQRCWFGLQPLIIEWLERHGYRGTVFPKQSPALDAPDVRSLARMRHVDWPLLNYCRDHERAMIRYQAQKVKPAQLIAEIALAWPDKSIAVMVPQNWDAHDLGHRLTKYLPDVDVYAGSDRKVGRVVVALPGHLGAGPIQIEQREIAICTSPAELLRTEYGSDAIKQSWAARLYGLLPLGEELAPYDRDMVWSVFGMDEVTVLEHGLRTEPITVIFSHVSGGPRLNSKLSLLEVKRQGIWINPVRNRRVAHLARALAENDEKVLAEQYGDVAKRSAEIPEGLVAILVENAEHAVALAEFLPDWPICSGSDVWLEGLPEQVRQQVQEGRKEKESKYKREEGGLIVTHTGYEPAIQPSVVVRADTSMGLPIKTLHEYGISTVIDFDDRHHPMLGRNARRRRAAYLEAGCSVTDMEVQATSPLDRFLATRPGAETW
ncbi:MAG: hypothetical protein ACLQNE_09715 [Thermoguttaceae bacterium]